MVRTLKQLSIAQVSSALATAADYLTTAILFQFVGFGYAVSTLCGTTTGGLLNCTINYIWTFPHCGCAVRYVLFKYALVWYVSMSLNTQGTVWLASLLEQHGMDSGLGTLMTAKVTVSVIVAVFWNFLAHKYFVYRDINIKRS